METNVSFGNLVVKFGKKDLLDYGELVVRAFLTDTKASRF